MKIPDTGKKKALIVVDVQPAFINDHNSFIIGNIQSLINKVSYDAYVTAVFSAEKGSIWDIQKGWTCSENEDTRIVEELKELLELKEALQVHKETRSVFRGNHDVQKYLEEKGIDEVHIVGTETDDCVLATVFDAFDSGFLTYVLEECTDGATAGRNQSGLDILRIQGLTNNRCLANTMDVEL